MLCHHSWSYDWEEAAWADMCMGLVAVDDHSKREETGEEAMVDRRG